MYALLRALPTFRDAHIAGEIVYPDHAQRVPQGSIDQGFVHDLTSLIRRTASRAPRSGGFATSQPTTAQNE